MRVQHATGLLLATLTLLAHQPSYAQSSSRQIYLNAREHLVEERFEKALAQFQRVISEFPSSDEADDAQYYVGLALAELGRYNEALEAYSVLLERWPDSVRVERARARRAQLLASVEGPKASDELIREVFDQRTSWPLKRDTAYAMARKGNLAAADVLERAMERESSSRQIELARILSPLASRPAARRILILGLSSARSSSVKLRALRALEPVASKDDVADAIGGLLSNGSSSSVKMQAVQVLRSRLDSANARQAMAAALDPDNSSSVRLSACSALSGYLLSPEVHPSVLRVFEGSASSSVRLRCLASLQSDKNDLASADVLREAISNRGSSSSVRLRAIQIAGSSQASAVRAVAVAGLTQGNSSSVQLRALRAISETRNDEAAAEALNTLFQTKNVSSSVLIAGVDALANHMETAAGPDALGHALSGRSSTSVQLKALRLASEHLEEPEIKKAVLTILERNDTSTSVVLRAIGALGPYVHDDSVVRDAFVRTMESGDMPSTARVRAAERLVSGADVALSARIADAMEDVIVRASRRGARFGRGHRDVIEDAFDILEDIDADRAESLRSRSRSDAALRPRVTAFSAPAWSTWQLPML